MYWDSNVDGPIVRPGLFDVRWIQNLILAVRNLLTVRPLQPISYQYRPTDRTPLLPQSTHDMDIPNTGVRPCRSSPNTTQTSWPENTSTLLICACVGKPNKWILEHAVVKEAWKPNDEVTDRDIFEALKKLMEEKLRQRNKLKQLLPIIPAKIEFFEVRLTYLSCQLEKCN